jgi:prophage DNA circulation protein
LRRAVGDFIVHSERLIQLDQAGPPLADCYEKARLVGVTQKQLAGARAIINKEETVLLGATLIKQACINFCLITEAIIIADMTFVCRQDVEALKLQMNAAFAASEEVAADDMDQMTYRALVQLHAAVTFHLIETARPLPRLIPFEFSWPMPTLQMAHRLYDNAARCDELRAENRVVHPAFAPRMGLALSA